MSNERGNDTVLNLVFTHQRLNLVGYLIRAFPTSSNLEPI